MQSASSTASKIIVIIEITAAAIVILAAGTHFWNYFNMNALDITLQIAFVALLIVMVTLLANVIISRWW